MRNLLRNLLKRRDILVEAKALTDSRVVLLAELAAERRRLEGRLVELSLIEMELLIGAQPQPAPEQPSRPIGDTDWYPPEEDSQPEQVAAQVVPRADAEPSPEEPRQSMFAERREATNGGEVPAFNEAFPQQRDAPIDPEARRREFAARLQQVVSNQVPA